MNKKRFALLSLVGCSVISANCFSAMAHPGHSHDHSHNHFELPRNQNKGLFQWGYQDSGLVLGRISNFESRGYISKSWEFTFNFGDIGETDSYNTTPYNYSTLEHDIFNKAVSIDHEKPYVLKYNKSILRNPFARETDWNIVDIYPTYIGSDPKAAGLSSDFIESNLPSGAYSSGKISGRIIKVQRWGTFYSGCAITLHMKGTKNVTRYRKVPHTQTVYNPQTGSNEVQVVYTSAPYVVAVMNVSKLAMNSEEGCLYAESILPFGKTVEVKFAESYTGILDFSRAVKSIHIK